MAEPLIVIPGMESSFGTLMDDPSPNFLYLPGQYEHVKTGVVDYRYALRATVVGNCINRIAEQVAALRWTAPESPAVQRLLDEANDLQTSYDMMYSGTWDMLLKGKAFFRHVGRTGRSAKLGTLDYEEVTPGARNGKSYYKVVPAEGRLSLIHI